MMSYMREVDASQDLPQDGEANVLASFFDSAAVVDRLCSGLYIPPSLQPPLELNHFSIAYWPTSDEAYENSASMEITMAELNNEIQTQQQFVQFLEEAEEHSKNLYTWRSLMRLFTEGRPGLDNKSAESIAALKSCVEVMDPEIRKVAKLRKYNKEASQFLANEIHKFSQSLIDKTNKCFYSETCLITMGKLIGAFTSLDNLICFNAAFKNDFANYSRMLILVKQNAGMVTINTEDERESGELRQFFSQRTPMKDSLFHNLQQKDKGSGLIINFFKKLVLTCAEKFAEGKYVVPSEREEYLKIISCCLKFIMQTEKKFETNYQVFKKCFSDDEKKLISKCFKEITVLKDFGDVPIDETQLLLDMTGKTSSTQGSLENQLGAFQTEHGIVVCKLMELVRHYNLSMETKNDSDLEDYLDSICKKWYEVCVRALKCLGSITGAILSFYVWKLCNGVSMEGDDISSYSKVTRYNYKEQEKQDLTIAIGLAKGLQNLLLRYESIISFLVGRHCFARLHTLVNYNIPETMNKGKGKDRPEIKMYVDCLIRIAKKFKNPYTAPHDTGSATPKASIGPGNTQLYMIRSILEWLCSSQQIKLAKRASDLRNELMQFHEETFYWIYALNLSSFIPKAGDLSPMWFRESYLTMEVAKANPDPQFGLSESIPWILAEHLLESETGSLIEHCLIPFELYNDSAEAVLKFFRKRHLFDELEAEVSLGFEQLMHWIHTHVFENAIERALFEFALSTTTNALKTAARAKKIAEPKKLNYSWLLHQSNIIVLGQSINLRDRMTDKFNELFTEEIAYVFNRLKSGGFPLIWETHAKLEILSQAHKLLKEDIALIEFDFLLAQAKSAVFKYDSFQKVIQDKLVTFIFPMFNFDLNSGAAYLDKNLWNYFKAYPNPDKPSEIVYPPLPEYRIKIKNKSTFCINASRYVEDLFKEVVAPYFSKFFYTITDKHYHALIKLASLTEISAIVKECRRIILENLTREDVKTGVDLETYPGVLFTLMQLRFGMKASECKLKPNILSCFAQLVAMHGSFSPIILYKDFDYLVNGLTEVGNSMIFMYHLEKNLKTDEAQTTVASAMFTRRFDNGKFINMIGRGRFLEVRDRCMSFLPTPHMPEDVEKIKKQAAESANAYVELKRELLLRTDLSRYINPECRTVQLLHETLDVPEQTTTFFGKMLFDLQKALQSQNRFDFNNINTETRQPSEDHVTMMPEVIQFHWLWSAIIFGMAKPKIGFPATIKSQFSDGAVLTGCAMVALMGQKNRFRTLDLCNFLHDVHEAEQLDSKHQAPAGKGSPGSSPGMGLDFFDLGKTGNMTDMNLFLKRCTEMRKLTEKCLTFLESVIKATVFVDIPQA